MLTCPRAGHRVMMLLGQAPPTITKPHGRLTVARQRRRLRKAAARAQAAVALLRRWLRGLPVGCVGAVPGGLLPGGVVPLPRRLRVVL